MIDNNLNNLVINDDGVINHINYKRTDINSDAVIKLGLQVLLKMFNEDPESIFTVNTLGTMSFILKNDIEISLHLYENVTIL